MEGRCGRVLLVVGQVAMLLGRETTLEGDETPCWIEPQLLERQTFMSIRVAGLSSQLRGRIDAPVLLRPTSMSGGYILLSSCLTDSHGYHLKLGVLTSGSLSVSNCGNRKQGRASTVIKLVIDR